MMQKKQKNKCFVACQSYKIKGMFEDVSRLYAFPSIPSAINKDEFIILDSGAFGLSVQGKEIDESHMTKLYKYYKKYKASNDFPILAIAPDKFLDSQKSMQNYLFFIENFGFIPVPVIQFNSMKKIDMYSALQQLDFYEKFDNKVIAISNPGLKGKEAKRQQMQQIVEIMKKQRGIEWIHCLGAGWNTQDCKDWFDLGFDSIDSISYYTDAEHSKEWNNFSYTTSLSQKTFKEIVLNNYLLAQP